ncbi:hypothetical protein D8B26_000572 [Coccidioides posadasii str. Silveira]|uniref:uncharacterized protein n=1 Tax=Coccidioides posadasii (strain RMSCC 757 / Silveira) TaxID=443226 RepID=UPI001BEE1862|nr:hypothetical protein D8B26_000572 [Coccidioides posadasii str. Silveira]
MPPALPEFEELEAGPSFKEEKWVIIPVEDIYSDGDERLWPTDSRYEEADPTTYLEKLAKLWMQHIKKFKPDEHYVLSQLPKGYALLSRERRSHPHIRDKFLFGHPSGVYFNSANKFWDHFVYLMNGGTSPCNCDLCILQREKGTTIDSAGMPRLIRGRRRGKGKQPAGATRKAAAIGPRRRGRRKGSNYLAEDEEGLRDVFKELVYKLKIKRSLDEPVEETDNMDWRAEREQLVDHLTRISMQHRFIPRVGELVLWCPELKGDVKFDFNTDTFRQVCPKTQKFLDPPEWRAGTVAQVPEELVLLGDIYFASEKSMAINMSGFRIETFPDPNSPDKAYSSQYKYVPLSHTRPFNMWDIFMQNIPSEYFHPSIFNALTVMPSFSFLDRYRFAGTWPHATIYCKGVYIGAELLVKGDTVRIMPENWSCGAPFGAVTDVLTIEEIVMELYDCDADLSSPLLSEKIAPRVKGQAYTISKDRAYRDLSSPNEEAEPLTMDEVMDAFETVSMRQYGPWYRLHPPDQEMEVSINLIIGRCFEADYMRLMLGSTDLDLDFEGVISGRVYGRDVDDRIPENSEWFAGDYRLETLALETFNGIEVGKYDDARDLKMWRANLRIIDGTATSADVKDAKLPQRKGRRVVEDIIGGKADSSKFKKMGKTSSLVSTALAPPDPSTNATSNDLTSAHDTAVDEDGYEQDDDVSSIYHDAKAEADESEDSLNVLLQMGTTIVRGGTTESEGGDYVPPSSGEPTTKRRKF